MMMAPERTPCKGWPIGHRLRRLRPWQGVRSGAPLATMRSTARSGWPSPDLEVPFDSLPVDSL